MAETAAALKVGSGKDADVIDNMKAVPLCKLGKQTGA
jgi:hypothetical protein